MHRHLVIPHLFWPASADNPSGESPWTDLRLPALERLLARARLEVTEQAPLAVWAARQFGLDSEALPIAPWQLLGDGIDPGMHAWVCLSPMQLEAGARQIIHAAGSPPDLSPGDVEQLLATLNEHLASDGICLVAPQPTRWYARCESADFHAAPPPDAGQVLAETSLPRGPEGARWRRLLTEMQMLLHNHPVNEARERRGQRAVNALWAWGAGRMHTLPARAPETWITDDPLLRGLARSSAAEATPSALPLPAAEPTTAVASLAPTARTHATRLHWLHTDAAARAVRAGDVNAWRDALRGLDAGCVKEQIEALRAGAIGMLTLHAVGDTETLRAELTRHDLRRFWRRTRPLEYYVATSGRRVR